MTEREWQSIETAPKDGTRIRALVEIDLEMEEYVPSALMGGWKMRGPGTIVGWQPLPALPVTP